MTSNFIPYLPSSPPPLTDDEDDDDEFGSFTIAKHLCNDKVTENSKTSTVREKNTIEGANGDQSSPPTNNATEKSTTISLEIESESHNKLDVNGTNSECESDNNIEQDIPPVTVDTDSRPSTSRCVEPEESQTDAEESERSKQTLNSSDQSDEFADFVIPSELSDYSTTYQNDDCNDDFESHRVFPKTDVDVPDLVFNPVFNSENSFDESPQTSSQVADDCNDSEWLGYTSVTHQNASPAGDDEDDEFSEFVSPPSDDALLAQQSESKYCDVTDGRSDLNCKKNESSDSRRNSCEQFEANFEAHFDDFETADSIPFTFLSVQDATKTLHNSFETNNVLHEEIIESLDIYSKPSVSEDAHANCNIWLHLSDSEKTDALSFQWSNSNCNKKLLKAINIDSRNLLFGHNWNSSVPLFAANLSLNPLEPTKTSPKTNDVTEDKESITSSPQEFIPPAQFDWNSSGLINPLDGLENELLGSDSTDLDINCTEHSAKVSPMLEQILSSAKLSASNLTQTKASTALSHQAQFVLNKLPDLRFMQAKVLMFPIRSATP